MTSPIILSIDGRPRDLGGFSVRRILPHHARRMVGPFIFFDHLGPAAFAPGDGIDVRPHPHIGLSTVTYLFEGRFRHRDSLGTVQDIGPGAVNWMTAGRGIAHSERTPPELRASGHRIHGIQTWVALPLGDEDCPPAFVHHPAATIPRVDLPGGGHARIIAGRMWGATSPVQFPHPIIYAEIRMPAGSDILLDPAWGERALYIVSGAATVDGLPASAGVMQVLADGDALTLRAQTELHAILCGGAPMDGPRLLWWNLVASDQARIDAAKAAWGADPFGPPFGPVPQEQEFIPLPAQ